MSTSQLGHRRRISSRATRPSSRASAAPRQKWRPYPNARCAPSSRWTSNAAYEQWLADDRADLVDLVQRAFASIGDLAAAERR
jgi:hypothetical protein